MTTRVLNHVKRRLALVAALAVVGSAAASVATATPARADWDHRYYGHPHHYYHHHWRPGPVYYGYPPPPTVVYGPPPVVYAPPVVYGPPSLNVVIPLR